MFGSDNTRPPPPSGRPPPYTFVTRVYKKSLRPIVIFCGFTAGIWALIWAVGSFQDIDDNPSIPKLTPFNIVLGILYMTIVLIECYGLFATFKQSIPLVRIYSWASVFGVLVVAAAELMGVILHFTLKNELINQCAQDLEGDFIRFRFSGVTSQLNLEEAREVCEDYWERRRFSEIGWLVAALLLGSLFTSITFSYYRQLLDPSSVRTTTTTVAYRMDTRTPYAPHGPIPGYAPYNSYPDYVPPYDPHQPPGYAQGGWNGPTGNDEKAPGYGVGATGGYAPPSGAPPAGAGAAAATTRGNDRDEGFDPAVIQAAIAASEADKRAKDSTPSNNPFSDNNAASGSGR